MYSIGFLDPQNMVLDTKINFLCSILLEIYAFLILGANIVGHLEYLKMLQGGNRPPPQKIILRHHKIIIHFQKNLN